MRQTLVYAAFCLGLAAPTAASAQQIAYGPILGRGVTGDQMIVKWGTGAAADATSVSYRAKGSTAAYTTVTGTASKDHEIVLTGLATDMQYEYYVQSGATKSSTYNFTTCPAPGAPMDVVFYGDSRDGSTEHQKIVNAVIAKAPEVVFESGDLRVDGVYSGYLSEFFPVVKNLVSSIPFMASPGNHDANSNLATNFGLLMPTPRAAGTAWKPYYAFTCGNAAFISLNGNSPTDAAQKSFLTTQLAAAHNNASIDHVFLWWHQSAYSPGANHGDDTTVQSNWVSTIEAEPKVTAVFSGHDHIYARMQHGSSKIAYVVSGGAGAGYYDVGKASAATPVVSVGGANEFNFVQVHIAGGMATGTAYNDVGGQIDSFTITQSTSGGGGGGGGGDDGGVGGGGGTGGGTGGTGGTGGNGNTGGSGGGMDPGAQPSSGCSLAGGGASSAGAFLFVMVFGALVIRRRARG